MNYAFFEGLSTDERDTYLARFIGLGEAALPGVVALAEADGVRADLSIGSIEGMVRWVVSRAGVIPSTPDLELPDWVRESETYAANLFDLDEPTKLLVLRLAFYLGESFVRSDDRLTWVVGRVNTAPQGQPVVTGFAHKMEMPVLIVSENLVARAIADETPSGDASKAVLTWQSMIEGPSA